MKGLQRPNLREIGMLTTTDRHTGTDSPCCLSVYS